MTNSEKIVFGFAEALVVETNIVTDNLSYQSIPQWDSITHMILIAKLEEIFEVSFDTDEIIDLSSFAKAKDILSGKGIIF